LQQSVHRLALDLAARYRVSLQQFIEALVLGCAERDTAESCPAHADEHALPPGRAVEHRPADVIPITRARRGASRRAQAESVPLGRIEQLVHRSRALRARAAAVCESARRVRAAARALTVAVHG
jgi:hypothetical protein